MAVSMEFIENLKQYTKVRKKLSEQFSVSEKVIQQMVDALIKESIASGGIISEKHCVSLASNEKTDMYSMFDWTTPEADLLSKADSLLDSLNTLNVVISSDNKMFKINHHK